MTFVAVGVGVAGIAAGAIGSAVSAGAQSDAANKAAGISQAQYDENKQRLNAAVDSSNARLDPYQQAGLAANNQQRYAMGLGGTGSGKAGALNQDFNMAQYRNDPLYTPMVNSLAQLQNTPGYQFQLGQGLQSVNNSAAAKGSLLSGGNLKAINDYAQGTAATGYQAAWDRAQQAYTQAFANNTTNRNNTFNRLNTMSGSGQNAATQQGTNSMNGATALTAAGNVNANNQMGAAMYQGQNTANMYTNLGSSANSLLGVGLNAYNKSKGIG